MVSKSFTFSFTEEKYKKYEDRRMTRLNEKQMRAQIVQKEEELKHLYAQEKQMQEDREKARRIKARYTLNDVPDRIEYNWEKLYKSLKEMLTPVCLDEAFLCSMEKQYSTNYGPDPVKKYPCPKCGESNVLYVGDYSEYMKEKYAITCSNCEFQGPMIEDYGEA